MKQHILYLFIGLFVFSSCDEYLDVSPDNRQEITTQTNLKELLVSAYSEASYVFLEWKTDNAVAIDNNKQFPELHENFQFRPVVSREDQDTPSNAWMYGYNAIAHANQALEKLDDVPNDNQELYNAIKAEALITRAYHHFILANIFCQAYDKATATTLLGIPYCEKPETDLLVDYERGTLQETYDKIQEDLEAGLGLLNEKYEKTYYGGAMKYHFNTLAAYAFASRFYLFKREYQKCLEYSNRILGDGLTAKNMYRNMQTLFSGSSYDAIGNKFIDIDDPGNIMLVRKVSSYVTRSSRGYRSDDAVFDAIFSDNVQNSTDFRDRRWGSGTNAVGIPKFTEFFEYVTATTGYAYYIQPVFRTEEIVYNRMEALVETDQIEKALADYNNIAPNLYENGGQLTLENIVAFYKAKLKEEALSEKQAMMQFLLEERRKEFVQEGNRWWDIKRFNLPVTHIDIRGDVFELKANDLKKAIQLPEFATINGLQANPR